MMNNITPPTPQDTELSLEIFRSSHSEKPLHLETMTVLGKRLDPILCEALADELRAKFYNWFLDQNPPELIVDAYNKSEFLAQYRGNVQSRKLLDGYFADLAETFFRAVEVNQNLGGRFFTWIHTETKPLVYPPPKD